MKCLLSKLSFLYAKVVRNELKLEPLSGIKSMIYINKLAEG